MAKPNKIKVFISHAHKDKNIVTYFVENVLENCLLKNYKNDIRCTSLDDSTILVGGNNLDLFKDINSTILFIPYISSNYHKSEFCLLEAGAAHIKTLRNKIYVFPILDEFTKPNETIFTLIAQRHAIIKDNSSLLQLHKICNDIGFTSLPSFSDYENELDTFVNYYNKVLRKTSKSLSAKNLLLNAVENSFHSESNLDFPVTLFVNRTEYEEFSMNAIKKSGDKLLWTLFGSPILIDPKDFISPIILLIMIKNLKRLFTMQKFRLIIFPDKTYAKAYLDDDEKFYEKFKIVKKSFSKKAINTRKIKFEDANKECLYFTTKKNIIEWANESGIEIDFKTFDFEFAFISKGTKNKKENFGITSGFHSNSF